MLSRVCPSPSQGRPGRCAGVSPRAGFVPPAARDDQGYVRTDAYQRVVRADGTPLFGGRVRGLGEREHTCSQCTKRMTDYTC